ncbi:hypothetical protein [Cytophaga aurantiaca]|uniref:hypothetical protein n=1 Tax=Cytophaga aurantiaca TaxID=29530 RepID=UPI0003740BD8|nr:hypothetical protein [Cytophaga aurantiaca]
MIDILDKKCFVIMPISDQLGYNEGHFDRVYEYIIKPACLAAGFKPIRADEVMTTNHIAIDIIRNIINCEMAVCDLSSKNPNVLYELGIRQAFNLPVTLLKDHKTERIFDIQEFRDVGYDESLRIDNVQDAIENLTETIKNTYNNKNEVNSLVSLLGIESAKITEKTIISVDTTLILKTLESLDQRLYNIEGKIPASQNVIITKEILPANLGEYIRKDDAKSLKKGDELYHTKFGIGVVDKIHIRNNGDVTIEIDFSVGRKTLILEFARLRKVMQ